MKRRQRLYHQTGMRTLSAIMFRKEVFALVRDLIGMMIRHPRSVGQLFTSSIRLDMDAFKVQYRALLFHDRILMKGT